MKTNLQPPQRLPVLTEVVVLPKAAPDVLIDDEYPPIVPDPAYADTTPAALGEWAPSPHAPGSAASQVVDEAMIIQRVLADLDKQLDLMFEHRLRETLAPVLARTTDTLVREMRNQLAVSLREMVARAVSLELDRLQKR